MRCEAVPIKKNQTRALQVLIDPAFTSTLILYNTPEEMAVRQHYIDVRASPHSIPFPISCCCLSLCLSSPRLQAAVPKADKSDLRILHGDLEYHILLVRLFSVSTEGKNGVAEATCQNLYTPVRLLTSRDSFWPPLLLTSCAGQAAGTPESHEQLFGPEDCFP